MHDYFSQLVLRALTAPAVVMVNLNYAVTGYHFCSMCFYVIALIPDFPSNLFGFLSDKHVKKCLRGMLHFYSSKKPDNSEHH